VQTIFVSQIEIRVEVIPTLVDIVPGNVEYLHATGLRLDEILL
jgi:hypothetical protein